MYPPMNTPPNAQAIKSSTTTGTKGVVEIFNAPQVVVMHKITGGSIGGYVTVELSPDGTNWFPIPSSFGAQPSAATTTSYIYAISPSCAFMRATLHCTDGTHDVWITA
jgi:hypothetical protein